MNLFTFRTIIKYVRREHKSNEVIKMISTESRDFSHEFLGWNEENAQFITS